MSVINAVDPGSTNNFICDQNKFDELKKKKIDNNLMKTSDEHILR